MVCVYKELLKRTLCSVTKKKKAVIQTTDHKMAGWLPNLPHMLIKMKSGSLGGRTP